jgi:tryptophan-rich sensory protein
LIKPDEWYDNLNKPDWTPPRWVFPVVWTSLYILIALAAMRLALRGDSAQALALWSVQIALNTLWTPVYFGLRRIKSAMVVMVCLWLAVAVSTWTFFGVDFVAGLLFLPYLIWVSIAGVLNFSMIRLNPQQA